jgi:hypothetical protein
MHRDKGNLEMSEFNRDTLTVTFGQFDAMNLMVMYISAPKTLINSINSGRANVSMILNMLFSHWMLHHSMLDTGLKERGKATARQQDQFIPSTSFFLLLLHINRSTTCEGEIVALG